MVFVLTCEKTEEMHGVYKFTEIGRQFIQYVDI